MQTKHIETHGVSNERSTAARGLRGCTPPFSGLNLLMATVVLGWGALSALAQEKPPVKRLIPGYHYQRAPDPQAPQTDLDVGRRPAPRPVIHCENPVHDFGTVWTGPALTHSFTIKNLGKVPLEVERVRPSCGCTVTRNYPRTIAPGGSGQFEFQMASSRLNGRFEKTVSITTNDPGQRTFVLRLRGEVKQFVEMTPRRAFFGKLFGDQPAERVIKLSNNTDEPLELEITETPDQQFDVQLVPTKPGQDYELRITAKPPFTPGKFRDNIALKTNVEEQDVLSIPVHGEVPQRLDVNPSVLDVRTLGEDAKIPLRRIVRFTNYGSTPAKLLEAAVDSPAVETRITEQKPGSSYLVQVHIPSDYEIPDEGHTLTLKTDDSEQPVITVPIRSHGRKQRARAVPVQRPTEEMVGQKAPRFALKMTDENIVANDDLEDSVTVLNFFAVNCGFCKKQIPRVEKVRQDFEDRDVRFIAVSQTMRNRRFTDDQVIQKINELSFRGEVATDPGNRIGPLFRATSYPTMVVLGKSGKIEAVNIGNTADLEKDLTAQIEALLDGKPATTARTVAQREAPQRDNPDPQQDRRETRREDSTEKEGLPPDPDSQSEAGSDDQPRAQREVKPVAQPSPPTVRVERRRPDDVLGNPAPSFSLETFDGKPLSNDEFSKYKATVLNFVAANCGFCKKQIPRLEKIRQGFTDKDVRFVNVVQTMRTPYTREQLEQLMNQLGSKLEMAHDPENRVGPPFGATGYPTMVIVGGTGKVEAVNVGNIPDLETRVPAQLAALIEGKPMPDFAAAQRRPTRTRPDQLIGKDAPAITLETFDGKPLTKDDLTKQKATVLNFVAGDCGFCKKQIPRVEKLRQEFADKGVRFVNVVQTMRTRYTREQIEKILGEVGSKLEVAHDADNQFGPSYGASAFPTMVVVGGTGKIEAVNVGNVADLEQRLTTQLNAILEGKPVPQAAARPPQREQPQRPVRPAQQLEGQPAPSFNLTTLEGKSFSNEDFKDHPATILNFVAPDCGFCKRQVPTVEKVRQEFAAKGVRFINVVQKMRRDFTPDQIENVFKTAGANLELSVSDFGTNAVGRQGFKVTGFPTLVVVGNDGVVKHVHIGAIPNLDAALKSELESLIDNK